MVSYYDFNDKNPFIKLTRAQAPYFFTFDKEPPLWNVIIAKSMNIIGTVLWNFTDIFIIAISHALTTHMKLFNAELERIRKQAHNRLSNKYLSFEF